MRKHRRRILAKQAFGEAIFWDRFWSVTHPNLLNALERRCAMMSARTCFRGTVTGRLSSEPNLQELP